MYHPIDQLQETGGGTCVRIGINNTTNYQWDIARVDDKGNVTEELQVALSNRTTAIVQIKAVKAQAPLHTATTFLSMNLHCTSCKLSTQASDRPTWSVAATSAPIEAPFAGPLAHGPALQRYMIVRSAVSAERRRTTTRTLASCTGTMSAAVTCKTS